MSRFIEELRDKIPCDIFTDVELTRALPLSPNSRYGLVKRAIARGDIIHVCRGLYAFAKRHQRTGLSLFEVAQSIYRPSYISLETALSHHGLIPEGVPTVTSVSLKRSREFHTPLGVFSYSRISSFNLIGVDRIGGKASPSFMAEPAKALVDYVYVYKKDWRGIEPLIESLRIEADDLQNISPDTLHALRKTYRSKRIRTFIDGLMEDLHL